MQWGLRANEGSRRRAWMKSAKRKQGTHRKTVMRLCSCNTKETTESALPEPPATCHALGQRVYNCPAAHLVHVLDGVSALRFGPHPSRRTLPR